MAITEKLCVILLLLLASGCSPSVDACANFPKQKEPLNLNLSSLPEIIPNKATQAAIKMVYRCKPPHPITGGPATIRYIDVRGGADGLVYLRFRVKGLSDITIVYLADSNGHLMRSYLYGS